MANKWTWLAAGMMVTSVGCTDGGGTEQRFELEPADALADEVGPVHVPIVVTIPLGLTLTPLALEVGDFNGDGATDLLVAGVEPMVGVAAGMYLGDGTGSFAAPFDPGLTGCSAFPTVGDLTGDGRTDVIISGCNDDLVVFEAQPDGSLLPWAGWPDIEYGPVFSSAVADFEGDGDGDLLTMRVPDSAFLDIALGNGGEGIWSLETTEVGNPNWSGFAPQSLTVGHFDDDGLLDVSLIEREHDVVTVRGTAPANFAFPRELGVDIPPWSTRGGDLDRDGLTDLVVSSYSSPSVQVLRTVGGGAFEPEDPALLANFAPFDTALGDMTGDGFIDVAMVDDTRPEVQWLQGDGAGGLRPPRSFVLPSPAIRIHTAMIDADDRADLVTATFADDSLTLVLSND